MRQILEKVKIQKYQGIPNQNITGDMALLDENDTELLLSIVNLQKIAATTSSDIFYACSFEHLQNCLSTNGKIFGIFVERELIAYRLIYFPHQSDENLGRDLLFSRDILDKIAHFSSVVVHPDYRGNFLALKMNLKALNILHELGYSYICGTVSPQNFYNLNIIFQLGFVIKRVKVKYGNKLRYIYYKNLNETKTFEPKERIAIHSMDIYTMETVLQQGLVGYNIRGTAAQFSIVFGRI